MYREITVFDGKNGPWVFMGRFENLQKPYNLQHATLPLVLSDESVIVVQEQSPLLEKLVKLLPRVPRRYISPTEGIKEYVTAMTTLTEKVVDIMQENFHRRYKQNINRQDVQFKKDILRLGHTLEKLSQLENPRSTVADAEKIPFPVPPNIDRDFVPASALATPFWSKMVLPADVSAQVIRSLETPLLPTQIATTNDATPLTSPSHILDACTPVYKETALAMEILPIAPKDVTVTPLDVKGCTIRCRQS
ncbi:hypothetical protein FQA39_LY04209 [Lamprigera yunnana]|nr:hypothetical protein FQA39_LY04209 [Lamprigera yunnana]